MREIKFRGKRIDNGELVYGNYFHNFRKNESHNIVNFDFNTWFEIDPETLGEFTGLKDKNGVEIYESDLVQIKSESSFKIYGDTAQPLEVEWDGCCYSITNEVGQASLYYYVNSEEYEVEVLGNKFQNPELLTNQS